VSGLGAAIAQQGHRLIFLNVLLQQIGVPVPAEPTLVVAGSLAARGRLSLAGIAVAALVATLLADLTWFVVGKRYGTRALRLVFRLSSSPEKHLGQTERLFLRWGPAAFALAKFIPGLPMAGPLLAGGLGTTLRVFLIYDLLAMGLWAGAFTGLGALFQRDVERALGALDRLGGWGLLLGGAVVAGVLVRRWYKVRALAGAGAAGATTAATATAGAGLPLVSDG
jgi:membrane protein DedA with SNARE-associated domain